MQIHQTLRQHCFDVTQSTVSEATKCDRSKASCCAGFVTFQRSIHWTEAYILRQHEYDIRRAGRSKRNIRHSQRWRRLSAYGEWRTEIIRCKYSLDRIQLSCSLNY
ncbi:hypothetical protein Tcan_10183 [Toxocara canis]|uniref:Uncharacterized protein n=1 Tax=Toxocara canis TaxID=6265 RepID=A0A0B2V2B8_TOXCA|nr:hypothetical protein Tcan_10183 [Toxocara canis]